MTVKTGASLMAALAQLPVGDERVVVLLEPGIYHELVVIDRPNVSLIGQDAEQTVLVYNNASGTPHPDHPTLGATPTLGTSGSASVILTERAQGFRAENITFKNSFDPANPKDGITCDFQAVALRLDADQSIFINCVFTSYQDTLYLRGNVRVFISHCLIEGDVDFIFGCAQAYITHSEIRFRPRAAGQTGYITAANTGRTNRVLSYYGLVFNHCTLTKSEGTAPGSVYLGRPWRQNANVVFKNSWMDDHIHPEGWTCMSGGGKLNLPGEARFFEFNNTGPGAAPHPLRTQLTPQEAVLFTPDHLFGSNQGLHPTPWSLGDF